MASKLKKTFTVDQLIGNIIHRACQERNETPEIIVRGIEDSGLEFEWELPPNHGIADEDMEDDIDTDCRIIGLLEQEMFKVLEEHFVPKAKELLRPSLIAAGYDC